MDLVPWTRSGIRAIQQSIGQFPDADNDRPDDRLWLIDQQVGFLQVKDDDADYPVVAWNNLITNGSFNLNGKGWTIYGWGNLGFDDWAAESGNWGLWIREDSQMGTYMDAPASAGNVYTFTVRGREREGFDVDSCYIKTEIYDVNTNKLVENEININSLLTTEWKTFTVAVTSPASTVFARGVIGSWDAAATGTNFVMFDNANMAEDAAPMKLMIGSTVYTPSEQTTNALFVVDAAALADVDAGNPCA